MKVLIIEDHPMNRKLAVAMVKNQGYEVLQAEDAEKGLAIAESELPSLILMDIQLPGMDGIAAIEHLKKEEKTRNIPVIALTAYAMAADLERITNAGFDDYVIKPIEYKKFIKTVEASIKKGVGSKE